MYGNPYSRNYAEDYPKYTWPSDWITPQNMSSLANQSDAYYVQGFNGKIMHNELVPPHKGMTGNFTMSTSNETAGSKSLGLMLSIPIPATDGLLALNIDAGLTWGTQSTNAHSKTLSWTVSANNGDWDCFDVIGLGGYASKIPTANMLGIYYWPATQSGNSWTCVTP